MEKQYRLLAVDDDPDILRTNKLYLEARGYQVDAADHGAAALGFLRQYHYDCILLDVLLPDLNGFTLCRSIRSLTSAPILFLSCMDDEEDKVKGLMAGGDDYITKPYSMKELAARIHAQVRRGVMRGIVIDHQGKGISMDGQYIPLAQKEFELMLYLLGNPGRILPASELYEMVWQTGKLDTTNTVAVYIRRLRRKLEEVKNASGTIETLRGEGYRWISKRKETI